MNPSKNFGIAVGFFLSFSLLANAAARTWTESATGKKIEADYVRFEDGNVILKMGPRFAQVPLERLSAEDQAHVRQLISGVTPTAGGTDWPRWRGSNHTGISPDKGLLKEWPEGGPKKLWVYEKAGMGYSGYSITGGKLFTMGTRGSDLVVICLDGESGEEIWSTKIGEDDQKGYSAGWGHGPRSTPTYSGGKVYALGPKGTLACLSVEDGKKVWDKDLPKDFGGQAGGWGFSESPLVDGDKVVIGPGGSDAGVVALNKDTGATIWASKDVKPGKAEYASIVPVVINDTPQYIRFFAQEVVGVKALDGSLLWKTDWGGKTAVIPTPIIEGNEIYITSGYGAGSKMFKVGAGNETEDVWKNTVMKNHHGGVVKIGDHVYGFSDGAGLICQDFKTGELVWNEKGQFTSKGAIHAADGMLYCLNEGDGTVLLVEATPEGFNQKGQFKLDPQSPNRNPKGKVWTHPVVIGGKLFLRDQEYIVCYDVKAGN